MRLRGHPLFDAQRPRTHSTVHLMETFRRGVCGAEDGDFEVNVQRFRDDRNACRKCLAVVDDAKAAYLTRNSARSPG